MTDGDTLKQIVADMAAAQTARDFVKHWSDDVAFYDVIRCSVHGFDDVLVQWQGHFDHIVDLRAEFHELHAVADGDVGFVRSVQRFWATGIDGWADIDIVFRQTDCFQRRAGKWQLVHQHASVPVDFATGLAMTNSFGLAADSQ